MPSAKKPTRSKKKAPAKPKATKAGKGAKRPAASRPKSAARAGKAAAKRPKRAAPKKRPARKPKAAVAAAAPPAANEPARLLARAMADAVLDKKARDVVILDVRGKASYADYIVLASGESQPQVRAMAEGIEAKLKEQGNRPISREGEEAGSWLLLDYGEVVAHLFDQDARGFYDLEGLWADAPREQVS